MKRRSDEEISAPLYAFDAEVRSQYGCFAGVDEAGRGPLCGPVCVAACILDPEKPVYGINVLDLLLHHAQGLGHVAREPLNIVLVCKPGIHFVHFTTPKSVKGIKHSSTLPRISRSSMQPT